MKAGYHFDSEIYFYFVTLLCDNIGFMFLIKFNFGIYWSSRLKNRFSYKAWYVWYVTNIRSKIY